MREGIELTGDALHDMKRIREELPYRCSYPLKYDIWYRHLIEQELYRIYYGETS